MCGGTLSLCEEAEQGRNGDTIEVKEEKHGGEEEGDLPDRDDEVNEMPGLLQPLLDSPKLGNKRNG